MTNRSETPTTEQVREAYSYDNDGQLAEDEYFSEERAEAFDRWLAAHDAEVAATALRDAADAWSDWDALSAPEAWLRARADVEGTTP